MTSIYLSKIPDKSHVATIQHMYAAENVICSTTFNQYVLIKINEELKILCKHVPQINFTNTFARCEMSVVQHMPNQYIDPSVVKLDIPIECIEKVTVCNAKRIFVSVIFSDVKYQNDWSNDTLSLTKVIKNCLRLFVVHNHCIVNLNKLGSNRTLNIVYILIHRTDCNNNAARITTDTNIVIIKTMSYLQFQQVEIGLKVEPVFGLASQVSCLKNIIEVAKTTKKLYQCSFFCNQIMLIGPSGCGKTRLVQHVAASLKCILLNFLSTDFINSDPGSTEISIRNLFLKAKLMIQQDKKTVCIIMLEKSESILNGKNTNAKRICAQLQDCLATIQNQPRILVISTTSLPQFIDPSFKQGSRFSYEIYIGVPSESERSEMFFGFFKNLNIDIDSNISYILARLTPGYTAADIELVTKEFSNNPSIILELKNGSSINAIKLLSKYPASSLKSGIGQVITKSESIRNTNLGGLKEAKSLFDICIKWPLIYPESYRYFAVTPPKGVLLYGPPGCGKTSLVRAIASSSDLNVLTVMAAELYSLYLGVTETNISQLFQRARSNVPSILFIDEIDALVSCRTEHKESAGFEDRVLSTFLVEMDGISNNNELGQGVIVVAATNRPDKIDAALLRPGRFDKQIYVPPPSSSDERLDILSTIINSPNKKIPISDTSILDEIAHLTDRFSAADLASIIKEAGMVCLTNEGPNFTSVKREHFMEALNFVKPSLTGEQVLWYENFASRR
ncbi:ribosome biogenesis protein SPATA5L1-like isoform X1 [Daktulosphaira vitifoliae]|uniref:ribosome biogenesis protein SPATA5L1-like isoform X1 n=1 Tax=Daktulosphaira vitifoliae TaxID=58002 RepID=UPI0021AA8642|nr:ribosome biogenesis protein SPATA5L1-like isoform X1 [Daktulosphaira vitifoliae]